MNSFAEPSEFESIISGLKIRLLLLGSVNFIEEVESYGTVILQILRLLTVRNVKRDLYIISCRRLGIELVGRYLWYVKEGIDLLLFYRNGTYSAYAVDCLGSDLNASCA